MIHSNPHASPGPGNAEPQLGVGPRRHAELGLCVPGRLEDSAVQGGRASGPGNAEPQLGASPR
jgi:hypothetical protein